jgi:hypothetical protein
MCPVQDNYTHLFFYPPIGEDAGQVVDEEGTATALRAGAPIFGSGQKESLSVAKSRFKGGIGCEWKARAIYEKIRRFIV